jgi:hypothetical protein
MSVQEMIQAAQTLSVAERKQLIKALVDMLAESAAAHPTRKRSLHEFRGRGAHLYDGTNAQAYVSQIRSEWDDRP